MALTTICLIQLKKIIFTIEVYINCMQRKKHFIFQISDKKSLCEYKLEAFHHFVLMLICNRFLNHRNLPIRLPCNKVGILINTFTLLYMIHAK